MGCIGSKPADHSQKPANPSGHTEKEVQQRKQSGSVRKGATKADGDLSTVESANARKYEEVRDVGSGAFGVCKLMRNTQTGELVAVKQMERGDKIDINVEREVLNHKQLVHPNVVQFQEVFVTDTHLCVALEYAAGGELFDTVSRAGKLPEIEARYFFQQLVLGLEYCHRRGVVHRDLKLENLLLDGSPQRHLKIADFGYSKNMYASQPKSTVGTVAYIAPEVLTSKRDSAKYKGPAADLWSSGVILFVMLSGSYPFEDAKDPRNMKKTVEAILDVRYTFPKGLSRDCRDLLKGLFQKDANERFTIAEIKQHPWFKANLPEEMSDEGIARAEATMRMSPQTDAEIQAVLKKARSRLPSQKEIEFFAKHGYAMGQDPPPAVAREKKDQLKSFDSDFIEKEMDDYMNGMPDRHYSSAEHDGDRRGSLQPQQHT